jgi:hypothetical protein
MSFQVFESGKLVFVYSEQDAEYKHAALALSQFFYMQGRFSPEVVSLKQYSSILETLDDFSVVYFGPSSDSSENEGSSLPCAKNSEKFITLNSKGGLRLQNLVYDQPEHAAIFLSPGSACLGDKPKPLLVLNVLGNSVDSFMQAFKLLPTLAPHTVPDYLVVDTNKVTYRGIEGILAAGFWDANWEASSETGYLRKFSS